MPSVWLETMFLSDNVFQLLFFKSVFIMENKDLVDLFNCLINTYMYSLHVTFTCIYLLPPSPPATDCCLILICISEDIQWLTNLEVLILSNNLLKVRFQT